MRGPLRIVWGLLLLVSMAGVYDAWGQVARERGGASDQALQKAKRLLREVSGQRDKLQAENAELQARVDELEQQLEERKSSLDETQSELSQSERQNQRLNQRLEITRGQLEQVVDRFNKLAERYRETARELNETSAQRQRWQQVAERRAQEIEQCEAFNEDLYQVNTELLERYEKKGVWDALRQAEPFTGLKQVQIEKLRQEYRTRLEDSAYAWDEPKADLGALEK